MDAEIRRLQRALAAGDEAARAALVQALARAGEQRAADDLDRRLRVRAGDVLERGRGSRTTRRLVRLTWPQRLLVPLRDVRRGALVIVRGEDRHQHLPLVYVAHGGAWVCPGQRHGNPLVLDGGDWTEVVEPAPDGTEIRYVMWSMMRPMLDLSMDGEEVTRDWDPSPEERMSTIGEWARWARRARMVDDARRNM